jgi:polysaccharide export outer membrane protein
MTRRAASLLLTASLTGCGPILTHPSPPSLVAEDERRAEGSVYRLEPGDRLEIRHLIDTDYTASVTVRPDGAIAVPGLRSEVVASGQTAGGLAQVLAPLYRDEARIERPDFTVVLHEAAGQSVYVGGEVMRPGMLEMPGGPRRIVQILMAAGWLLPTARRHEVLVVREGVDGEQLIFPVDLTKIATGEDLSQNVWIRPRDAILVPRSDIASFDRVMEQYVRQALPTSTSAGVFYQFNNPASAAQNVVK